MRTRSKRGELVGICVQRSEHVRRETRPRRVVGRNEIVECGAVWLRVNAELIAEIDQCVATGEIRRESFVDRTAGLEVSELGDEIDRRGEVTAVRVGDQVAIGRGELVARAQARVVGQPVLPLPYALSG